MSERFDPAYHQICENCHGKGTVGQARLKRPKALIPFECPRCYGNGFHPRKCMRCMGAGYFAAFSAKNPNGWTQLTCRSCGGTGLEIDTAVNRAASDLQRILAEVQAMDMGEAE